MSIKKNIIWLALFQFVQYAMPILTFPYLTHVIGVENFGHYSLSLAVVTLVGVLIDMGLGISATSFIAQNKDRNYDLVKNYTTNAVSLQLYFAILILFLLCLIIYFSPQKTHFWLYLGQYMNMAIMLLVPIWFFQGMNDMKRYAIINIIPRLTYPLLLFIFIKKPSDYNFVPWLQFTGSIAGVLLGLHYLANNFKITFQFKSIKSCIYILKQCFQIFISNILISIYATSATIILGIFTNPHQVGIYVAAERIFRIFQNLLAPISTVLFTKINEMIADDKTSALQFIRNAAIKITTIAFITSLSLYLSAPWLPKFVGEQFDGSVVILQILSPLPLIIAISNICGIQIMVPMGHKKMFSLIISTAATMSLFLSFALVPNFGAKGTATTMLAVEASVTIMMFCYIARKKLLKQGDTHEV